VQGGRSTGYVPGKATSPRGIGPWNGKRRSGAPQGAWDARSQACPAKYLRRLRGAPLPLFLKGEKSPEGAHLRVRSVGLSEGLIESRCGKHNIAPSP